MATKYMTIAVLVAAGLLIGAQAALGTIPPWLFYPVFAILAGGRLGLEGQKIWRGYRRAADQGAEEGRLYIVVSGVMLLVIGVAGYFFITS
jgi:hypothetical protein